METWGVWEAQSTGHLSSAQVKISGFCVGNPHPAERSKRTASPSPYLSTLSPASALSLSNKLFSGTP